MDITENARRYHEKMFPHYQSEFAQTDPEFIERFDNFAFGEVINNDDLDDKTRFIAIAAALIGFQAIDEYKVMLPAALRFGISPVEIKEIVYQSVAYVGIGRAFPFLKATNDILIAQGVSLPLEGQATTTTNNRREKGEQAQIDIFGESMRGFAQSGNPETRHINKWLVENCFGDYYTRTGLDYKQREMITFCLLAAQGGCESQLISHAKANIRIGNDKSFLVKVVSQCLPYIGYPRSLNTIRCVEEAAKVKNKMDRENLSVFPVGEKNEAYAEYFIGQSYLNMLSTEQVAIGNVTFEPRCRNNWHIHRADKGGGQILLVTAGKGWYQEYGRQPRALKAGDVVNIPANVKHWHGAAKDSYFQHLAIEVPSENGRTEWYEPVSDEEYDKISGDVK